MTRAMLANNISTTLSAAITSTSATTFSVVSATGMPAPTGGQYFYCTLLGVSGVPEIVKVTGVSGTTLTCVRGQDGTTAATFAIGDSVKMNLTAAMIAELADITTIGLGGMQIFTAGGTFTIPSTKCRVTVVGGGGGGHGSGAANMCGGGGGAGGMAIKFLTGLTVGNTLTVAVGAAGGLAAAGGTSSVSSGTQTITAISANGGAGGVNGGTSATNMGYGGAGGTATGGDTNIPGNPGFVSLALAASTAVGGNGGSSIYGAAGQGNKAGGAAAAAAGYGAGGSGVFTPSTGVTVGNPTGAPGVVIIEW